MLPQVFLVFTTVIIHVAVAELPERLRLLKNGSVIGGLLRVAHQSEGSPRCARPCC